MPIYALCCWRRDDKRLGPSLRPSAAWLALCPTVVEKQMEMQNPAAASQPSPTCVSMAVTASLESRTRFRARKKIDD